MAAHSEGAHSEGRMAAHSEGRMAAHLIGLSCAAIVCCCTREGSLTSIVANNTSPTLNQTRELGRSSEPVSTWWMVPRAPHWLSEGKMITCLLAEVTLVLLAGGT